MSDQEESPETSPEDSPDTDSPGETQVGIRDDKPKTRGEPDTGNNGMSLTLQHKCEDVSMAGRPKI